MRNQSCRVLILTAAAAKDICAWCVRVQLLGHSFSTQQREEAAVHSVGAALASWPGLLGCARGGFDLAARDRSPPWIPFPLAIYTRAAAAAAAATRLHSTQFILQQSVPPFILASLSFLLESCAPWIIKPLPPTPTLSTHYSNKSFVIVVEK